MPMMSINSGGIIGTIKGRVRRVKRRPGEIKPTSFSPLYIIGLGPMISPVKDTKLPFIDSRLKPSQPEMKGRRVGPLE